MRLGIQRAGGVGGVLVLVLSLKGGIGGRTDEIE